MQLTDKRRKWDNNKVIERLMREVLKIVTWNVRGTYKEGVLKSLEKIMEKDKVDILQPF